MTGQLEKLADYYVNIGMKCKFFPPSDVQALKSTTAQRKK